METEVGSIISKHGEGKVYYTGIGIVKDVQMTNDIYESGSAYRSADGSWVDNRRINSSVVQRCLVDMPNGNEMTIPFRTNELSVHKGQKLAFFKHDGNISIGNLNSGEVSLSVFNEVVRCAAFKPVSIIKWLVYVGIYWFILFRLDDARVLDLGFGTVFWSLFFSILGYFMYRSTKENRFFKKYTPAMNTILGDYMRELKASDYELEDYKPVRFNI